MSRDDTGAQFIHELEPNGVLTLGRLDYTGSSSPFDDLTSCPHAAPKGAGTLWTLIDDGASSGTTVFALAR